jgi:hypothetical protein
MKTYFICNEDNYGQRIGTYFSIELNESEIKLNRLGFKEYRGRFLYEDENQVLIACQN